MLFLLAPILKCALKLASYFLTFLLPYREGACKKTHILKLSRTGKFALNVVDNLVVVHHQDTEVCVVNGCRVCVGTG